MPLFGMVGILMKAVVLEQFARIGTALSNPSRLSLLDLLCQSEKTVETLVEQSKLPLKNVSAQLKVLKEAGLVKSRKEGKYVRYSVSDERVALFWSSLQAFGTSQMTELRQIAAAIALDPDSATAVDRRELMARAKRDEIVVIDVRPKDEFEAAHLPYAISVPLAEIKGHLKKLPKSKKIVAYCRGPYCLFAKEAVALLKRRGFKAVHLRDGVQEWKTAGQAVVAG